MSILRFWPVAVPFAMFGAVFVALAQCAVAEGIVRFVARINSVDECERATKIEEWTRHLNDMKPRERPAHAGAVLWMGIAQLRATRRRAAASPPAIRAGSPATLESLAPEGLALDSWEAAGYTPEQARAVQKALRSDRVWWWMVEEYASDPSDERLLFLRRCYEKARADGLKPYESMRRLLSEVDARRNVAVHRR